MDEIDQEGIVTEPAIESENKGSEITYSPDKDFYRGLGGELRYKAEGLFKKAKEKGISIEEITIDLIRENRVAFPGIGEVDLPAYVVKVRGKDIQSGQVIADGKSIDYYNRYQKYVSERIEKKNLIRDERGKALREGGRTVIRENPEMELTEWEKFEIGKDLIDDKEFGLEKTITGACDRIIRKLMGENDWLYPEEARLLDEEFNSVQNAIAKDQEYRKQSLQGNYKRATDRQINYLKAKIKNMGLNPEDNQVMREVIRQSGFGTTEVTDLSTSGMSKIIDGIGEIIPRVRETMMKRDTGTRQGEISH